MLPSFSSKPKENVSFSGSFHAPERMKESMGEKRGGHFTIRVHSSFFSPCPCGLGVRTQFSFREPLKVQPGTCPRNHSSAVGYILFPALRMRKLSLRVSEDEGQMAEAPGGQEWEEQKKGWEVEAWLPPPGLEVLEEVLVIY